MAEETKKTETAEEMETFSDLDVIYINGEPVRFAPDPNLAADYERERERKKNRQEP